MSLSRIAIAVPLAAFVLLAAGAARAARQRFAPPTEPGRYAVGHTVVEVVDPARDDRTLLVDLWYPADAEHAGGEPTFYRFPLGVGLLSPRALDDAARSATLGFPLVVYSHGHAGIATEAAALMESLAGHGFVVAAPTHTGGNWENFGDPPEMLRRNRPLDVSLVIDRLLAIDLDPSHPLYLAMNPYRIGVAGYSWGGWTAIAVAGGHDEPTAGPAVPPDPRVRAVACVAPGTGDYHAPDAELAAVGVPLLLLTGTADTIAPIDPDTLRPWTLASGRPLYRADVVDAAHEHFGWSCDFGEALLGIGVTVAGVDALLGGVFSSVCLSEVLPVEEANRIRSLYVTAFFQRHLLDDPRYDAFLTPAYAAAHEPSVVFQRKDPGAF